ncbi:MAG: alpha/beta fold hydrolase [Gaiellales bacterium]
MTSKPLADEGLPPSGPTSAGPTTVGPTDALRGHIGRIVAGSLIGGLVGAILLVVGPFAGGQEHVITGSVLLVFAFAWAMLAVLSESWTDQPQRWARVPAIFMGLAGIAILGLAPTGNEAGWIWPPAVVALVVWMTVRARSSLRSRTRAWLVYPVFASLLLSAIGGAFETYREGVGRSDSPMPGRLVDVGGHKLHINCTGSGSPTVVLEPGLGEPSTAMAWIAPAVATTTRVCVYDRAGRGWSQSADKPLDGVQTASDLHTLLERAGEHGPFVMAGHSAGGIYVLNYARLYPDDVAGVVLLDSMHPEQYTRIASWPAFYEMFRRVSAVLPPLSRFGVGRVIYGSAYGDLPAAARDQQRAFWSTPRHGRSVRDEFSEIRTAMNQARSLATLGSRPLAVITALREAEDGWTGAQDQLAGLSSNSAHRTLPDATHAMVVENETAAAQSSQAIGDVVAAVRTGRHVTESGR